MNCSIADHSQGACAFAGAWPPMPSATRNRCARSSPTCSSVRASWSARRASLREFGDQELILVGRTHLAGVGDAKGFDGQRAGWQGLDGLVGRRQLRRFLRHTPGTWPGPHRRRCVTLSGDGARATGKVDLSPIHSRRCRTSNTARHQRPTGGAPDVRGFGHGKCDRTERQDRCQTPDHRARAFAFSSVRRRLFPCLHPASPPEWREGPTVCAR